MLVKPWLIKFALGRIFFLYYFDNFEIGIKMNEAVTSADNIQAIS